MLQRLYDKYGEGKTYWILAGLLILCNILIIMAVNRSVKTFKVDDIKFRYASARFEVTLFKDKAGNILEVVEVKDKTPSDWPVTNYEFRYKNKVIKYKQQWPDENIVILSDGTQYKLPRIAVQRYPDYMQKQKEPFEVKLVKSAIDTKNIIPDLGFLFLVFPFSCIFIFLGLGSLVYPEAMWRFQHMFQVVGGEPTDWAIFSHKLGGVISIIIAVLLPLILVFR